MDQITTPRSFKEYLEHRYNKQLEYFGNNARFNEGRYKRYQWILIILSALTPVLASVDGKWGDLNFLVIIISAVVAVLTTALKTFRYQEQWYKNRIICELLRPELYYMFFNIGAYADAGVNKEALFISRVESILSTQQKEWATGKKEEGASDEKIGKGDEENK